MSQKRILYECNTVYQLLFCIHLKLNVFKEIPADIIITNIMNDAKGISQRIRNEQLFENVVCVDIKDYKKTKLRKVSLAVGFFERHVNSLMKKKKYSSVFISNPTCENLWIYIKAKKKNGKALLNIYEDGLSTYSKLFKKFLDERKPSGRFQNILYHYPFSYLKHYNDIYAFSRDAFAWEPHRVRTVKKIDMSDYNLIHTLNRIFKYDKNQIPADCKAIFFEESYYADKKNVNDIQIVNKIAAIEGKAALYVKLHPRNGVNRFLAYGIKTMETSSIPWELVVINEFESVKKIRLYSIASGALFSAYFIFDYPIHCISCEKMINDTNILFPYIDEVREKIINQNECFEYFNS